MTHLGLRPITTICDGAAENIRWIKTIGTRDAAVHCNAWYFLNPVNADHIIMTVDPVHSMKNWRGTLFSSGTVSACSAKLQLNLQILCIIYTQIVQMGKGIMKLPPIMVGVAFQEAQLHESECFHANFSYARNVRTRLACKTAGACCSVWV